MKKSICMFLCSVMLVSMLAGCASETEDAVSGSGSAVLSGPVELKVWHDGDEAIMETIAARVNGSLEGQGVTVLFEKKAGLTDQLKLYGSGGAEGPDMYLYAHDSLGTFAEMGILAPIGDFVGAEVLADLLPMTVNAGSYQGTQYLMPVYFETLLFMYNKALWEGEVPDTTEDLYAYMESHTDVAAGTYAVVNQHSTAYNVAPFINAFGGFIISGDGVPGLNDSKTKEAIYYNQKFARLQADGDYNTVTTLFNEGKAAAIIGGPWLVSGIRDAGIDLGIKSLADFKLPEGNGLAPFSGVQGVGVLKEGTEDKKEAIGMVLTALAGTEVGIDLAKEVNCAPANWKAYDDEEVAANEMIAAMQATAETALPMPNIPQMSVMWGPTEALLAAANMSGEDVEAAAEQYQQEALTAIADMQ